MRAFVLLAIPLAACTSTGSLVVVDVEAAPAISGVARVSGSVTAIGKTESFDFPQSPMRSTPLRINIQLPHEASGAISVHVILADANGAPLGVGDGAGSIAPGGTADVTINIGGSPPDMLMDDGRSAGDLSGTDLAGDMAPDLAPHVPSWTDISAAVNVPSITIYSVWGSGGDVFAVGAKGLALHSGDDGATWKAVTTTGVNDLHAVWGFSAADVFAVGDGTILRSTDRGANWSTPSGASAFSSTSFRAINGNSGVAVAGALTGTLAKWNGSTWSAITPAASIDINAIFAAPNGAGSGAAFYAFGTFGSDFYSTDSAGSWTGNTVTSPMFTLYGTAGASVLDFFIVADQRQILHTTNGGGNFGVPSSPLPVPATTVFRGVWVSGSEVYVVGNGGAVLHSVDSGATYTAAPIPSEALVNDYFGVWGSSTTDVYVVGNSGKVLHFN